MKKILLVVGHNEQQKGEYSNVLGEQEFNYWNNICNKIKEQLPDIDIAIRAYQASYQKEMQKIVNIINNEVPEYDLILEFHFNAWKVDRTVNGAECLVFHKSSTHEIAKRLLNELHSMFGVKNRGLKLIKDKGERGGYGIVKSKSPYILIEPFFGTNDDDANKFTNRDKVAKFFVDFIQSL